MLDFATATRAELRSNPTPWDMEGASYGGESPPPPAAADIIIVGAGITGALMAEALTAQGRSVLIIDPGEPALGSTAASTAMLQWEIDVPLGQLAALYGFARAATIYQRSYSAVQGLMGLVRRLRIACDLVERPTLYLARDDIHADDLERECALRRRVGLPGDFLDASSLYRQFRITREAAIASPGSCEADPVKLAQGLMHVSLARGARVLRDRVTDFGSTRRDAWVQLADGRVIAANAVVLATGYAFPKRMRQGLHSVASSWAVSTVPQPPGSLWRHRSLMWDASKRYNYVRTTVDNRIIIGGEDEEFESAQLRDALIPAKSAILIERLRALWPEADLTIDTAWAGAFGETTDGLPLIGRAHDDAGTNVYVAYGYGGNGITFSYMASRMIPAMIAGCEEAWFAWLSPERAMH